jgi:hypothetical protein
MPMRVIAKKRCRAMFEPPEKGERATLNPNLSTRLKPTFFRSGPWAAGWLLLVEGGRAALSRRSSRSQDRSGLALPSRNSPTLGHRRRVAVPNLPKF